MAYCFKRKESVAKAVRRLTRERIEHALACLEECDRAKAIHEVRKDIKKVRAVMRLVRARIAKKDFRRVTDGLREAARHLAAPRDAYVKAQALRNLAAHFKGQLAPGALRLTRTRLRRSYDEATKRFWKEQAANTVARLLRRVAKAVARVKVRDKEWKALGPGVKTAYRQGRRAYRAASTDPSPENFHAWRKRAKDLWYQARLLHPTWPEELETIAGELDSLGEWLGSDHDLAVLLLDVEKQAMSDGRPREREILRGLIERCQHKLRDDALALGARFYAEKPSVLCERLAGYWRTWRHEENSLPPVASAAS